MSTKTSWFCVDRAGLAKLIEDRPKSFLIMEALKNCFDEPMVTKVEVRLERIQNSPYVSMTVSDDAPEGWADLTDAHTLFAPSRKKGNADLRGWRNLGEKLILALSRKAVITTTTGRVTFDETGRHRTSKVKTKQGSTLVAEVRMSETEVEEALREVAIVIVPPGISLTVQGLEYLGFVKEASTEAALPTIVADEEGVMRPTSRLASIDVYKPIDASGAWLYELGVPAVKLECEWSVDVRQRVPLNLDANDVTPAYRRKVLAAVANVMAEKIEDASAAWVQDVAGSKEVEDEALEAILDKRFGKKRAVHDPSDPMANLKAVDQGYTLVYPRSLGKEVWSNVRRIRDEGNEGVMPVSGRLFPSPKEEPKDGPPPCCPTCKRPY